MEATQQFPLVSIIIPTFNRRQLLAETLQSVNQQTYPNIEIIVVDNGSTDGTAQFIADLNQTHITLINNPNNTPGSARNLGLNYAKGTYIKFFDSDDLMAPNTVSAQVNTLINSDAQMVFGPYLKASYVNNLWQPNDVLMHHKPFIKNIKLSVRMPLDNLFICIPSFLFERNSIMDINWESNITAYEDWYYLFKLAKLDVKIKHENQSVFIYRQHGAQTMGHHSTHQNRDLDKVAMLKQLIELNNTSPLEKILLQYRIFETNGENGIYAKPILKVLGVLLKIRSKLGRTITKTEWQPCHGPCADPKIINQKIEWVNQPKN